MLIASPNCRPAGNKAPGRGQKSGGFKKALITLPLLLLFTCGNAVKDKDYKPAIPTLKATAPVAQSKASKSSYVVKGKRYQILASTSGYKEVGLATWYGGKFHGRKTANGERFDTYKLTAAHKTLPFNIKVEVTNMANNKKVVVRINDRGPFSDRHVIDLSRAAANAIGMAHGARVKVEVVNEEQPVRVTYRR